MNNNLVNVTHQGYSRRTQKRKIVNLFQSAKRFCDASVQNDSIENSSSASVTGTDSDLVYKIHETDSIEKAMEVRSENISCENKFMEFTSLLNNEKKSNDHELINSDPLVSQTGMSNSQFKEELYRWSLRHNINNTALTSLLKLLNAFGIQGLPKTSNALKNTPSNITIRRVDPGEYWHFGLEEVIRVLETNDIALSKGTYLDVNIDGLPLYNSSRSNLWPILGKFSSLPKLKPFVIGVYHHESEKPRNAHEYVKDLLTDFQSASIKPGNFILDAPAAAFIKGTMPHNSYFACDKCSTKGAFQGRMCYPDCNSPLRTDNSFRLRENPEHHSQNACSPNSSALEKIVGLDMINNFPCDSLHVVLIGYAKKFLKLSTKRYPRVSHLTEIQRNKLSCTNEEQIFRAAGIARIYQTLEVPRSVRPIKYIPFFKASEFGHFVCDWGIFALKDNVHSDVYDCFKLLHVAFRICTNESHRKLLPVARELFLKIVEVHKKLFGTCMVSFNVHKLIHLVDDVERQGCLGNYSAFQYESKLGKLKAMIRSGNKPLQQIANRVSEHFHEDVRNYKEEIKKESSFPKCSANKIEFSSFTINKSYKNKWIITKSHELLAFKEAVFERSFQNPTLICNIIKNKRDYYDLPIRSSTLGIYLSDGVFDERGPKSFKIEDIAGKLQSYQINNNEILFIPQIQSYKI